MSASVFKRITQPVCLDIDSLLKIESLNRKFFGESVYNLNCRDDISREYSDIGNVKAFSNTPHNRIQELVIRSNGEELSSYSVVRFGRSKQNNIDINIQGEENDVEIYYKNLLSIIESRKPWYSIFIRFSFVLFISIVMMSTLLILGLLVFFGVFDHAIEVVKENKKDNSNLEDLALYSIMAVLFGFLFLLDYLKNLVVSSSVFKIGQESAHYDVMEKIRWIIIALIPTSVVGVVSLLI